MSNTSEWFPAAPNEEPVLTDARGQVRGFIYQQEPTETRAEAIAAAMASALECQVIVFVYDVYEAFVGTAYGY